MGRDGGAWVGVGAVGVKFDGRILEIFVADLRGYMNQIKKKKKKLETTQRHP